MSEVNLGDEVKCKVTGLKGIVTSIAQCLNGCDRATVQPACGKDMKMPDAFWVDVPQLIVTKAGKVKRPTEGRPGGPTTRVSAEAARR